MISAQRALKRLEDDLGELLAERRSGPAFDFDEYYDHPIRFIREVLGDEPWEKQEEIAAALLGRPQVTVRSCHAAGKDWLAARLALWWVYARRGMVVLSGPTSAQVEEILMRREVRRAFLKAGLPGELRVKALRPDGDGAAGILARTGAAVSAMHGFHDEHVLFVITEAQDPAIDHAWDAAFACATGEHDRILTLGNPLEPVGRFYRAHQPGSGWTVVKIAADDIPNVQLKYTAIPGLLTRQGIWRFESEYGTGSPVYTSRVLAEFPSEVSGALVYEEWIAQANELWEAEDEPEGARLVVGVDPARLGPDRTALCIRAGLRVRPFVTWRGADTMDTADRVLVLVRDLIEGGKAVDQVLVDAVGVGGGVLDRLAETIPRLSWQEAVGLSSLSPSLEWRSPAVEPYEAGRAAGRPDRFRNIRAQGYWECRKLLEDGKLALPPDDGLARELMATRVRFGGDGKTEIEAKDTVKARIGCSPDLADALVISLAPMLARSNARKFVMV